MPALENPQWERFCLLVASGRTQTEAYKIVYRPKTDPHSNAVRLAKTDAVTLRIRELQEEQRKRIGVSLDALLKELNAMYRLARRSKQPGAGVQATMAKAKLLGFVVDRAEVEGTMRRPMRAPTTVKKMSLEEWQHQFEGSAAPKPPDKPKPDTSTKTVPTKTVQ